jgi:hypothetical protein
LHNYLDNTAVFAVEGTKKSRYQHSI